MTNDTETLFEFWYVFLMVLTGIFAVVSSFVAMFQINGEIALWTLVFLPILGIVIWYYQKFSSRIYRNMREKLSQLNTKLNESISGMRIIQQFRQEARLAKEFEQVNNEYLDTRYAMIKTNSILLSPIINFLCIGDCVGVDFVWDRCVAFSRRSWTDLCIYDLCPGIF